MFEKIKDFCLKSNNRAFSTNTCYFCSAIKNKTFELILYDWENDDEDLATDVCFCENCLKEMIEQITGKDEKDMRYKEPKELRNVLCNFRNRNTLSHGERLVFDAMSTLDDIHAWILYKALYKYIDKFLWG